MINFAQYKSGYLAGKALFLFVKSSSKLILRYFIGSRNMSPGFVAVSHSHRPYHGLADGLLARKKSCFLKRQLIEPCQVFLEGHPPD